MALPPVPHGAPIIGDNGLMSQVWAAWFQRVFSDAEGSGVSAIVNSDISATAAIEATKIADGSISNVEFQYLNGVASAIQTQIDSKASNTSITDHVADTTDAHAASAITFTPVGTIAATNTQTAIAEVATDAASALASHEADTTSIHGITDTSILLTTTSTSAMTNKTFDAEGTGNALSNIKNTNIKAAAGIAVNKLAATTVNRAMASDSSGFLTAAATTDVELSYVNGVTSAIQTQLNAITARHYHRVGTGNGHGSTNTKIRKYTTVIESGGTDITYTSDATNGDKWVINTTGIYAMAAMDGASGGAVSIGISRNSNQLTTDIDNTGLTQAHRLNYASTAAAGFGTCVSWVGACAANDVIRAHDQGTCNFTALAYFSIARVG